MNTFSNAAVEDTLIAASTTARSEDGSDVAIRPFKYRAADADLADPSPAGRLATDRRPFLCQASASPRWPAEMQKLVRYWGSGYDWRKAEAQLDALPQFMTRIDGLDIQFIHVHSRHSNAMPVLITHGWPGSVIELLKIVGPLSDPTRHGGKAADAFDVIIPSVPGYGFSGRPAAAGWDPDRIGKAWGQLMQRLDYGRYVSQGGDWGVPIASAMARQAAPGLLGIHLNLPAAVPPEVGSALASGAPAPATLDEKERSVFDALRAYGKSGSQPTS